MKRHFGISIHKEGRRMLLSFAFFLTALNIFCFYFAGGLVFIITCCISIILLTFFTNFFRSPKRIFIPENAYDIVAPADGKIVVIEPVFEEGLLKEERIQVSIFMSVTDVHANWYPFEGEVIHYSHQSGRYQAAFLPKSSTENERSNIIIKANVNQKNVLIRQIAGALARRIVTYAYTGRYCHINEHLGFIKFGSRVDIFFPLDTVDILVNIGDHVTGNKTVIARFKQ